MTSVSGSDSAPEGRAIGRSPDLTPAGDAQAVAGGSGAVSQGGPDGHELTRTKKPVPVWQETLLLVGTAVILALIIKTFLVQAFYIPSGSMRDTLKVDDRILVQKVSYWFGDVQRGDIVVFDDPANWLNEEDGQVPGNPVTKAMSVLGLYPTGGHLVKRVIGVGGDSVACAQSKVEVNGVALDESDYVTLAAQSCTGSWKVEVPPDRIWVLGDNREHSADSRAHIGDPGGGFIPVDDIVGKVFVVVWPIDHWQAVHRPGTFTDLALDEAASALPGTVSFGLALLAAIPFYGRRRRNATRHAASAPDRRRTSSGRVPHP